MSTLHPVHYSVYPRQIRTPNNMTRERMPPDTVDALERIATRIFVDCANVGVPFGRCLLAVYLSGLHHGAELMKESLIGDAP